MGTSTDGILVYGWALDETALADLPWLTDEDGDLSGALTRRLLVEIAGFAETWEDGNDGYYERERAAEARLGVEIETHCCQDAEEFILAAKVITASRGYPEALDLAALQAEAEDGGYDEKLARAAAALGLTFEQPPGWVLASWWG